MLCLQLPDPVLPPAAASALWTLTLSWRCPARAVAGQQRRASAAGRAPVAKWRRQLMLRQRRKRSLCSAAWGSGQAGGLEVSFWALELVGSAQGGGRVPALLRSVGHSLSQALDTICGAIRGAGGWPAAQHGILAHLGSRIDMDSGSACSSCDLGGGRARRVSTGACPAAWQRLPACKGSGHKCACVARGATSSQGYLCSACCTVCTRHQKIPEHGASGWLTK